MLQTCFCCATSQICLQRYPILSNHARERRSNDDRLWNALLETARETSLHTLQKCAVPQRHTWSLLGSILIAITITVEVIVDIVQEEEIAIADPLTSLRAVGGRPPDLSCQWNTPLLDLFHDLRRGGTNRLHD